MSIQSINNGNYQNKNSGKPDFQTSRTDPKALQSVSNQEDQDQVTISESALSAALTSSSESGLSIAVNNVMNDLSAKNSQVLGIIHQIEPATVETLLHQTKP